MTSHTGLRTARVRRRPILARLLPLVLVCLAGSPAVALTGFSLVTELPNPDPTDANFGRLGLALSGDVAMVAGTGRVLVFERQGADWVLTQTIADTSNPLNFGNAVSLEGDVAVIASPPGGPSQTRYFVYVRELGQFTRKTELLAPAPIVATREPVVSDGKVMIPGGDALFASDRYALIYQMPTSGWPANASMTPTTVVSFGEDTRSPVRFAGDFDNNGTPVRTLAYGVSSSMIKVWDDSGGSFGHVGTLFPSPLSVASVGLAAMQGDTVIANVLVDAANLDYRLFAFHPPAGGWTAATEDAIFQLGDSPNLGLAGAAVSDTTLVARGIFYGLTDPPMNNADTLFVFSRASGARWTSSATPDEQLVVPRHFNRFAIDGGTILAGPFVYSTPIAPQEPYSIRDTLNDPSDRLLDYGQVVLGGQASANVVITNTGTSPLNRVTIGTPVAPPQPFSITAENCFGVTLIGGQLPPESCELTVSFSPTQAGAFEGQIALPITTAAGTDAIPIGLTGSGVTFEADIGIEKSGEVVILPDGLVGMIYRVTVRHVAGVAAPVMVEDRLSPRLTYRSSTTSRGGTYDPATGLWDAGSMSPGDAGVLEITTAVDSPQRGEHTCVINRARAWISDETIGEIRPGSPNQVTLRGTLDSGPATTPTCASGGAP
jgi:hypothetical protein